jgi:amino acid adenylation domain-containing protein
MVLVSRIDPGNTAYNVPLFYKTNDRIDPNRLRRALDEIVRNQESLRTFFMEKDDDIRQKIIDHADFEIALEEKMIPKSAVDATLTDFVQPFILDRAPLWRVGLFRVEDETATYLLFDFHHVIFDGLSVGLFLRYLRDAYKGLALPEPAAQNKDYAEFQIKFRDSETYRQQAAYWKAEFEDEVPLLELPTDKPRPREKSYRGSGLSVEVPGPVREGLKKLERETSATTFMIMFSVFNILLHKYTGQNDLVVGVPSFGRKHEGILFTIGMFVGTLPIRSQIPERATALDYILALKKKVVDAVNNEDYPLEELVASLDMDRQSGRNPLFDVMFALWEGSDLTLDLDGLTLTKIREEIRTEKFDLTAYVFEDDDRSEVFFTYATDLFDRKTIERFSRHYLNILSAVAADPGLEIDGIGMLSSSETFQIMKEWNRTEAPYPGKTLHELFEEQVGRTPEKTALVFEWKKMTYRELDQRANQIAHWIRRVYVERFEGKLPVDEMIGICIDRSFEMIIGVLAILKAGSGYVPLDMADPAERMTFKVEDCGCRLVLTVSGLEDKFHFFKDRGNVAIPIDNIGNPWKNQGQHSRENVSTAENLAYAIYTSGSTGKPKGIILEHKTITNLVAFQINQTHIPFDGRVLQYTNLTFDVSLQEIFTTLLAGGTLHLIKKELRRDIGGLLDHMKKNEIEVLFCPPALLNLIFTTPELETKFPASVKHIIAAGEQLIVNKGLKRFLRENRAFLHNHYGPSETHVVTALTIGPDDPVIPDVPSIGKPIQNTKAYILDRFLMPVPVGVPGELYLGGAGLARGYLRRPELTAELFIENPFADDAELETKSNLRLYKTGDLVKWLPEGNIVFLGRNDFQVKVRGFRVELGEIESRLNDHPAIAQCIVTATEKDRTNTICAYYTIHPTAGGNRPTRAALRDYLDNLLPDYMVPAFLIELDEMPLNANGKINRKVLPAPDTAPMADTYVPPASETEKRLAEIWGEVLKIDQIGINDNFFDLGGHSLNATLVVSRIHKRLHMDCTIRSLFDCKSIAKLAEVIDSKQSEGATPGIVVEKIDRTKPLPLSSAQERLWFLDRYQGGQSAHYNMPIAFRIKGALDVLALEKALNLIIGRHESLRTVFRETENGEPYQEILPKGMETEISLRVEAASESALPEMLLREANYNFDLAGAQLIRICLWRITGTGDHILLINQHHIISDGWSIGIFCVELAEWYGDITNGRPIERAEPEYQYADYALWQKKHLESEGVREGIAYWKRQLSGVENLNFPTDRPRPPAFSHRGSHLKFSLNTGLTERLKAFAGETDTTLYMTLLCGFYILLSRYAHQDDLVIGTPVANRHHAQFEDIIGFFVNTLALRINGKDLSVRKLAEQVRKTSLEGFQYQDVPLDKILDELEIERDQSKNPLFQTLFALQNASEVSNLPLPGLEVFPLDMDCGVSKLDLSLMMMETGDQMTGFLEFCTDLFNPSTMERFIHHFQVILFEMTKHPERKISELKMLPAEEYDRIIHLWNDTDVDYGDEVTIQALFEKVAAEHPDAPAVVFEGRHLSYRQLNHQANQVARTIREKYRAVWNEDITGDTLIGLYMERGIDMITGILGILKAGAGYVPFDPVDSEDRLKFKIDDCECRMVLTCSSYSRELFFLAERDMLPLSLDAYWEEMEKQPKTNLPLMNKPTDLAYVIYTSGSTGRPKGVLIEHRTCTRMMLTQQKRCRVKDFSDALLFASISFDASVLEIFTALASGKALHIASEEVRRNPEALIELIRKNRIAVATLPPAVLEVMPETDLAELKVLITAGDVCEPKIMNQWAQNRMLINGYGPTENTVCCTLHNFQPGDLNTNIGKPVENVKVYVLDAALQPVPVGVFGELHIGGHNLARGYFKRPDLTAERFIQNPFASARERQAGKNLRLYKTGDLVRWMDNGELEFSGRNDFQVKIRGYRIELGEIENRLAEHPDVRQCIVTARGKDADKTVCAYYTQRAHVSDSFRADSVSALRTFLASKLSDYMVPDFFIKLDEMPLNTSGKIDRKRLPAPKADRIISREYVAPRSEIEKKIAVIWREIVKLDRIGVKDGFFSVGGNSLNAARLAAQLGRAFLRPVPVVTIFQKQTIEEQAAEIARLLVKPAEDLVYLRNPESFTGTLILFPPGFAGAEVYFQLMEKLNSNIRVIGFNNHFLNNPEADSDDVPVILERYVNRLRAESVLNDARPVCLGGWSVGGNSVVSMLSLLEGSDVKKLFLFDAILFEEGMVIDKRSLADRLDDPENHFLAGLREAGLSRERIAAIVKRVETFAASLHYRKNPTAAVLFKAGLEDLGVSVPDEYSGWRKYLSRLEKIDIPTVNHYTMLSQPDSLDMVAQAINHAFF